MTSSEGLDVHGNVRLNKCFVYKIRNAPSEDYQTPEGFHRAQKQINEQGYKILVKLGDIYFYLPGGSKFHPKINNITVNVIIFYS